MFAKGKRWRLSSSAHIATIVVMTVAFTVAWFLYFVDARQSGQPPYSLTALVVSTVLAVFYLALLVSEHHALGPVFGRHAKWINYALLIALMLVIEFLLAESNIIWLISMPLVALAAIDLSLRGSLLVYLMVMLGMFLPILYHEGNWTAAALSTLSFTPAVVFVIIFAKITESAEIAQKEAESLAVQLADANQRLGDFAIQAEELATTQERNRLAREIHDNLGHYLTVANIQIKAAHALLDKDPQRAGDALEKAASLTQEGLAAVRRSVSSLRDSPLGRLTLPEAIAHLAGEIQATGIVTEFHQEGETRPLDPRAELTLYRAAQEGLTNARKHARASRVDLTLSYLDPGAVSLVVHDNGIGSSPSGGSAGFGLLGLRERARQLGGRVAVTSRPGEGYRLSLELPMDGSEGGVEEAA